MDIYETEEQQVDAIKGYWKKNGNAIIAGLVIGFSGFVGFNFYQDNQLAQKLALSDDYQRVLKISQTDTKAFHAQGDAFITETVKDKKQSAYAALTALALAKETVSHKDWAKTEKYLTTAINTAPSDEIKAIATLRLARVQIQSEQVEQALTTLSAELPSGFIAAVEEIKGDAYFKQGKKELARNSYQVAIAADGLAASPALQVKLDNLAQVVNLPSLNQ